MAVEQPQHRHRRRMLFGQVLRSQTLHRRDECGRLTGEGQGISIGAPLVPARERIDDWCRQQRQRLHRPAGATAVRRCRAWPSTPAAAPRRQRRRTPRRTRPRAGPTRRQSPSQDVVVHVMCDFVRQNDLDLVVRVLGQQRVGQDDAPRSRRFRPVRHSRAGFSRRAPIRRRRAREPRRVADSDTSRLSQRLTLERREPVEHRQEHDRRDPRDRRPIARMNAAAASSHHHVGRQRAPRNRRRRRRRYPGSGRGPPPWHGRAASRPSRSRDSP